jgi:hypothetical protein
VALVSLRRLLLELWAMFILALVVGFLGPFGTYLYDRFASRIGHWWMLLMGAYLLVRPAILLLRAVARHTQLPLQPLVFWGVVLSSAPLAWLWRHIGQNVFSALDGYAGLLPFSLLCALAVLIVTHWAEDAELRLPTHGANASPPPDHLARTDAIEAEQPSAEPTLTSRLSPAFAGPILALQSEDHYVRVHGSGESELLLMRLRDAIAEMGDVPGEQVHRSWWVARGGIAGFEPSGRAWTIRLINGQAAPVARESVSRLRRAGFLPRHPA